MTAPRILTCGWPRAVDDPALVWIHPGHPAPVTSATVALPVGWLCFGVAAVIRCDDTIRLEFVQRYQSAGDGPRLGETVALVLDTVAGGRHERLWVPRAELAAAGWEFALRRDRDGASARLFVGAEI